MNSSIIKRLSLSALLAVASLFAAFTVGLLTPSAAAHHCLGHSDGSEKASGSIAECLDAGACLDTEGQGGNCPDEEGVNQSASSLISTVINVLSFIVGVVAVIMIIIGGLKYITSGGDSGNVQSAKNTILYAIIGLVIVAFAQIIVRFVLSKSTEEVEADTSSLRSPAPGGSSTGLYRVS